MTDIEVPPAPVAPARTPLGVARGVLKTMRPRQWVKNVLVFAAPFVGGDLLTPGIVPDLLVAFVAFSLAASGIYLVNDAKDVAADRAHPTKRFRPIAAGIVPLRLAIAVAVVLLAAAVAVSLLASVPLVVVLAVYVVVQLAYCFWLKHQPVLDICIVASGFLLRAIAGGAATGILLSQWFLLVGGLRVAVHGGRQAVRGDDAGRADRREDPQVAGELLGQLPAVRVGAVGDGADHHVLPVGVRHRRGAAQPHLVGDLDRAVRDRGAALRRRRRLRQRWRARGDRAGRPGAAGAGAAVDRVADAGRVRRGRRDRAPATLGGRVRGIRPRRRRLRLLRADHRRARRERARQARARAGAPATTSAATPTPSPSPRPGSRSTATARTCSTRERAGLGVRQPVHRRSPATSTGCSPGSATRSTRSR